MATAFIAALLNSTVTVTFDYDDLTGTILTVTFLNSSLQRVRLIVHGRRTRTFFLDPQSGAQTFVLPPGLALPARRDWDDDGVTPQYFWGFDSIDYFGPDRGFA